jgi:hypothetical protein
MELENSVTKALQDMGFPIFYRNVNISYMKRFLFGEFDIVSRDFIVEVKSGRDITTRGIDFMYSQNLLPTAFRYYIYCSRYTDDEIAHLNEEFGRPYITYINDLAVIRANHVPVCECSVSGPGIFMRLLRAPLTTILRFHTIYMTKYTFIRVYRNVCYLRNLYSADENIMWSEKIMMLIAEKRIQIVDILPTPDVVAPLVAHFNTRCIVVKKASEPVQIPLVHSLTSMNCFRDLVEVRMADNRTYYSI